MRPTALLALCCLLGCAHAPSAVGPGPLRYEVGYAPGAITVTVEGASAVRDFLFSQPGAVERVELPGGAALSVGEDGSIYLPAGVDRFSYRFVPAGDDLFRGVESQGELLVAGRAYLIRPRAATRVRAVELRAPSNAHLPWAADPHGVFHLRGADLVDSGFHAFGGRGCPGSIGALDVRLLGPATEVGDARLCEWIAQAAKDVATVRHRLPHARVAVNLVPVPGEAASPFGMVLWSTPPSVAILVGDRATDAAFDRDWVATHELLHLAHPAVFPKQAWLTEGLATYFTELARWRSGRFTEAQAFTELAAGFARGEDEAGPRAFAELAGSEGKGSYLALYWKGAFFALELDLELRRRTGGARSLEDVLSSLGATTDLDHFGAAVDAIAGAPLFDALLTRHRTGAAFDRLTEVLGSLGVVREGSGVRLAPHTPLRDALGRAPREEP